MFYKGLLFSGLLHGVLLIGSVVGFSTSTQPDITPQKPIPVNIIKTSEFTKLKAGDPKKKQDNTAQIKTPTKKPAQKKKAAQKKKSKKAVKEATRKKAKPKAIPKKVKKKAIPKPKKKAVTKKPKKKAPTQKNAKIAKKDFSPDKIAALLNKIPNANLATGTIQPPARNPKKVSKGQSEGQDLTLSVNEIDAMRSKISQCWVLPIGGLGADQIIVKIRFNLKKTGRLERKPQVLNSSSSPFFRSAAESAIRAIVDCQPYNLPPQKYKVWRDIVLNFDPRQMYGG
ncbi:MAG: hypothetical protein AAF228_08970 [Pseudomonadota bacterium]